MQDRLNNNQQELIEHLYCIQMSSFDKRKSEDRTFPFTALPANGSTFQRRSQGSRSTCSNFSMDPNIQISNQQVMPILLHLKQQNQHLRSQKQSAQKQATSLISLTQSLISQNEALRLHFYQRSADIQQLIQSFSINTNENVSQTKHLVHSYRQHNRIIAKQIQSIGSKIGGFEEVVEKVGKELVRICNQNTKLDQNWRNRKVKNKILEKNIKSLQAKKNQNKIDELQKEICDLQVDINTLKKKNMATLNFIKSQKYAISNEKPEMKQKAILAIKSVKMLQQQLNITQFDCQKFETQKQVLKQKEESTRQKVKELYSLCESKMMKLERLIQKKKTTDQANKLTIKNIQTLKSELKNKQSQKSQLLKQLQQKKQQLVQLQQTHSTSKSQIQKQSSQKQLRLHEQMHKLENSINKAMYEQLNPEERQFQSMLAFYHSQIKALDEEILDMKDKVKKMYNPKKDILKIQLEIKRSKAAK